MTDYPRSAWVEPGYPITGPAPKQRTTQAVAHWPGGSVNPNTVAYLRQMQRSYVNGRGYSLGYWWYVEQNGDSWQIRGPGEGATFNSAANAGDKVPGNANDYTAPILFGVTEGQWLTPEAIATAVRLWRSIGLTLRPLPHSALDYTACCGDWIRTQIAAGELDLTGPAPAPTPPPTIPPPTIPPPPDPDPSTPRYAMHLVTPRRWYDTRALGATFALPAGVHRIDARYAGLPADATGIAMRVTTVNAQPGYLTVWGEGRRPDTSDLNYGPGTVPHGAYVIAPLVDRGFQLYLSAPTGLIIDATGYLT